MADIEFGVIGAGWRTTFFLRIAAAFPQRFRCVGVVVRDADKRAAFSAEWNIPAYATLTKLADHQTMDFVVVSASPNDEALVQVARQGLACLCETPPVRDMDGLKRVYDQVKEAGGKVQIAEQYHLRPHHQAQRAVLDSGKIGKISQAQVSIGHGYHGVSMMRHFLGIGFENATIRASSFVSPIVKGASREGVPLDETIVDSEQVLAWFHFENDTLGTIDFTTNQYRAWIRGERVLIRGERGEISNMDVRYLQSFDTPMEFSIERVTDGQAEDQKFPAFIGYRGEGSWLYRTPFSRPILMDDEIAIAHCLERMKVFVDQGTSFYSLSEALQDTYLGLLFEQAKQSGKTLESESQIWAQDPI